MADNSSFLGHRAGPEPSRIERADEEPTYTQEEVEQMMAEWHD